MVERAMGDIDHDAVWARLLALLTARTAPAALIEKVIGECERSRTHPDWARLRGLEWDAGADAVRAWLPELLASAPPPPAVHGLFFSLDTLMDADDVVFSDLSVFGTSEYDPDDTGFEWLFSGFYHPPHHAHPRCLRQLYAIAYEDEDDGLGGDAEWPLALAFGCAAAAHALAPLTSADFPRAAERLGIVAGFHDGDMIALGELTPAGFALEPRQTW